MKPPKSIIPVVTRVAWSSQTSKGNFRARIGRQKSVLVDSTFNSQSDNQSGCEFTWNYFCPELLCVPVRAQTVTFQSI